MYSTMLAHILQSLQIRATGFQFSRCQIRSTTSFFFHNHRPYFVISTNKLASSFPVGTIPSYHKGFLANDCLRWKPSRVWHRICNTSSVKGLCCHITTTKWMCFPWWTSDMSRISVEFTVFEFCAIDYGCTARMSVVWVTDADVYKCIWLTERVCVHLTRCGVVSAVRGSCGCAPSCSPGAVSTWLC